MLVEIIGLPGAGKTSLGRGIARRLRARRLQVATSKTLGTLESNDPNVPRYVSNHKDRTLLYRAACFKREFAPLLKHLETRAQQDLTQEFLFSLTAARYQAHLEHKDHFDLALLDEGFVHRGANAHLECSDPLAFEEYLQLIPRPDILIYLRVGARMAQRRAIARRSDVSNGRKKVIDKLGDLETYAMRRVLLETAMGVQKKRGAEIVEIDGRNSLKDCVTEAAGALLSIARSNDAGSDLAANA